MFTPINSARLAVAALTLTGIALPLTASAATTTNTCSVKSVGTVDAAGTNPNYKFAVNGSQVTSAFVVTGNDTCRIDVTMTAWTAPSSNGMPKLAQRVFNHVTGNFGPGTHSLTTDAPDCFFQFDIGRMTNPTAEDGTPNYAPGVLFGWANGGTRACVTEATPTPTPTPTATPRPTFTPTPTPAPTHTPTPTPRPTHTPTPSPTPAVLGVSTPVLPATGADALSGALGLTSMGAMAAVYIRSRRQK